MSERNLEKAVLLAEVNLPISKEGNVYSWEIFLQRHRNYKFYAYPGPEAAGNRRAEHPPYHIHIYSPSIRNLRVKVDNLEPMDEIERMPRELKKYLKENQEILLEKTKMVFHTGKVS